MALSVPVTREIRTCLSADLRAITRLIVRTAHNQKQAKGKKVIKASSGRGAAEAEGLES